MELFSLGVDRKRRSELNDKIELKELAGNQAGDVARLQDSIQWNRAKVQAGVKIDFESLALSVLKGYCYGLSLQRYKKTRRRQEYCLFSLYERIELWNYSW